MTCRVKFTPKMFNAADNSNLFQTQLERRRVDVDRRLRHHQRLQRPQPLRRRRGAFERQAAARNEASERGNNDVTHYGCTKIFPCES